jgi:DNA (cytosine-5)-methyltransferase 1
MNYYNEIDPNAVAVLRQLIIEGLIAPGIVDNRSIEDVRPSDLIGFAQCHFFAGFGIWSLALRQAGWGDNRKIWTASCPCQPFSTAGKGGGFDDERHLWPSLYWLIEQCHPDTIVGEQVAGPDGLVWFDLVSTDLENSGYSTGAANLCAAGVGSPQLRQRLYWLASTVSLGYSAIQRKSNSGMDCGNNEEWSPFRFEPRSAVTNTGSLENFWRDCDWLLGRDGKWRCVEPGTFPLAHGAAERVGRLRGYGNAIVGPLAKTFIQTVMSL